MPREAEMRILVVEDEVAVLMALEAVVEDEGYGLVGTALASGSAITCADATMPNLVLLDLNLADGPTGLKVAEHVRELGADILFTTANPSSVAGFDGAFALLPKPYGRGAMERSLRYVTSCILGSESPTPVPPELVLSDKWRERAAASLG